MKRLKVLAIQIEAARRAFKRALAAQNQAAMLDAEIKTAAALDAFYSAVRGAYSAEPTDSMLVFCDGFPDGAVLSQHAYSTLLTLMDAADLDTHTAVPVDEAMSDEVQAIVLSMVSGRAS
jgi:hypothetical protein